MKKFLKTIAGKSSTFVLCVLSICVLAVSVMAALFMTEFNYYTQDKETVYENLVRYKVRSDIYSDIWDAAYASESGMLELSEHDDLIVQITDVNKKIIYSSKEAKDVKEWNFTFNYGIIKDGDGKVTDIFYSERQADENVEYYVADVSLKKTNNLNFYSFVRSVVDKTYGLKYGIYLIGFIASLLTVASFVILMSVSGRRNEDDDIHPGPLNKIPFDILVAFILGVFILYMFIIDRKYSFSDFIIISLVVLGALLFLNLFIGLCMSLAVRIKQRSLITGTLTYLCLCHVLKIVKYLWSIFKAFIKNTIYLIGNIPLVWKTLIILLGRCFFELVFIVGGYNSEIFWLAEKIIFIPAVLYIALSLRSLQNGGYALASGDLSYNVDTKRMIWDFKKHGENLNSIRQGMAIAVNEQTKSERMKTELITNVSHDIKTPLTSIINYADLIGKEKTNNKKIIEYSEVLLRQSERLKRLIDDLVEASKASTGNLEVNLMSCDSATFINQAAGEYQDKLKESELTLITSIPDEELRIMADSRRMWRIFDNLMNNISKYAQKNTRVYLSLEKIANQAVFTFKNTSRDQLNISEEELMERFARGDLSRNTEGNGLGLSIAKSMAELQNGSLKLSIDGDLFKAILSFPLI